MKNGLVPFVSGHCLTCKWKQNANQKICSDHTYEIYDSQHCIKITVFRDVMPCILSYYLFGGTSLYSFFRESTHKIDVVGFFETLVAVYQIIRRHIADVRHLE
jgi:hypothetical protein